VGWKLVRHSERPGESRGLSENQCGMETTGFKENSAKRCQLSENQCGMETGTHRNSPEEMKKLSENQCGMETVLTGVRRSCLLC